MRKIENKDSELVEKARNGSLESFDELIRSYSSKMFGTAYGLLGSKEDAEEVVQDAFVKAHSNLSLFREEASFSSWIYRIVVNLCRNRYQWNRRRGSELNVSMSENSETLDPDTDKKDEMEIPDVSMSPDEAAQNAETGKNIMSAIETLPDKLREVIILRYVDDMSYGEISDLLNCELGTVKSRLARARIELAGKIKEKFL